MSCLRRLTTLKRRHFDDERHQAIYLKSKEIARKLANEKARIKRREKKLLNSSIQSQKCSNKKIDLVSEPKVEVNNQEEEDASSCAGEKREVVSAIVKVEEPDPDDGLSEMDQLGLSEYPDYLYNANPCTPPSLSLPIIPNQLIDTPTDSSDGTPCSRISIQKKVTDEVLEKTRREDSEVRDPEAFRCHECDVTYDCYEKLFQHLRENHQPHICQRCAKHFESEDELWDHKKEVRGNCYRELKVDQYCPWCGKHYRIMRDYMQHTEQRCPKLPGKGTFPCPIKGCKVKRIFTKEHELRAHLRLKHLDHASKPKEKKTEKMIRKNC